MSRPQMSDPSARDETQSAIPVWEPASDDLTEQAPEHVAVPAEPPGTTGADSRDGFGHTDAGADSSAAEAVSTAPGSVDATVSADPPAPAAADVADALDRRETGVPEQTQGALITPAERLDGLLAQIGRLVGEELEAAARQAVAEAERRHADRMSGAVDEARREIVRLKGEVTVANARAADEIARVKARAEELLAQRFYGGDGAAIESARREERHAVRRELDRLRRALSRLDDADSVSEILETVTDAVSDVARRVVTISLAGDRGMLWNALGFERSPEPDSVAAELDRPGLLARAIDTGVATFLDASSDAALATEIACVAVEPDTVGLAVPMISDDEVAAIVYADDAGRSDLPDTWPEAVGVLVTHAGRCLDALGRRPATMGVPAGTAAASDADADHSPRDRRESARADFDALPWLGDVRMEPGHDAALINVSDGGALVEAGSRLEPGTNVLLHFLGGGPRVSGQVLRCAVYAFDDERSVRYRGAIQFSEPLSEFLERAARPDAEASDMPGATEDEKKAETDGVTVDQAPATAVGAAHGPMAPPPEDAPSSDPDTD